MQLNIGTARSFFKCSPVQAWGSAPESRSTTFAIEPGLTCSRNAARPAWYRARSSLFRYLGCQGSQCACTSPLSSSDSSQVTLPTWDFIFPSRGAGSRPPAHDSRDIASGLIAGNVAALAHHEGTRVSGLEFAANPGEATPLSGTARL